MGEGSAPAAVASWQDRALARSLADSRSRSVERISSFVAAARRLATETGSSAFTVQQVVAASGQSLKSFYRYFEGKDDLLLALLEEDCAVGALFLGEMVGRRRTPQTRARAWVLGIFELMAAGEHGYVSVLVREHRRLAEERPAELELALRPFIELLAGDLADGMEAGQVRAGDPWRDARMILHLVLGAIHDLVLGIASPQARRVGDADAAAEPEARSRQVVEEAAYVWSFCWGGLAEAEAR